MAMERSPQYAGEIVSTFASAIFHGSHTLENVPNLLKRIVQEELWRSYDRQDGKQEFKSFTDFIEKGLGTNIATLCHLCKDDPNALDLLDQAVANSPSRRPKLNMDNTNVISRPSGITTNRLIRRLRTQRPDLHRRVLGPVLPIRPPAVGIRRMADGDRLARAGLCLGGGLYGIPLAFLSSALLRNHPTSLPGRVGHFRRKGDRS